MAEDKKNFLTTLPGILTGVAAVITAITTFWVTVNNKKSEPAVIDTRQTSANVSQKSDPAPDIAKPDTPFTLSAVIDDPDGFTNVRSARSATSQIVTRINENEPFLTWLQKDNWWQVKTANGKIGFVHVSRIRLLPKP